MPRHTMQLAGRNARNFRLTWEEAKEMDAKGFRFSVLRPQEDNMRLSIPYRRIEDLTHGTVTFEQDD